MAGAALSFEQVAFSYGGPGVLEAIDLAFAPGEVVAVAGPNGAGKTTLLRLAAGSLMPTAGVVRLLGHELGSYSAKQRARVVAVVPQETQILYEFSVHEVVLMGRSPHLGLLGLDGPGDRAVAARAMELTDVAHLAERPFRTLSGGERQRTILARALAQQPRVLLLDEPTAFLDLRHQLAAYDLFARLTHDSDLTLIVASHDLNLAARYSDRMLILNAGRVRADGTPHEVLRADVLREVYEVEVDVREDEVTQRPFLVARRPASACD